MTGVATLSPHEFSRLRKLVHELTGIALRDTKRDLLAGRLARRLRHHALTDFSAYLALLDSHQLGSDELVELVNCVTTNKTSFFREPHHFQALQEMLVPRWIQAARRTGSRRIRVWSAGCSTGEEPYTIAMTLLDALPAHERWDVEIVGTDIDTAVLATAARGVYDASELTAIPAPSRHWFEVRGGQMRVAAAARERVTFRQLNLIAPRWPIQTGFDAIFCRNVVIYFDRPTQERLFARLAEALAQDGRLFIGHSESLTGICDRFTLDGQTIYRLRSTAAANPAVESVIVGDVRASARPLRYTAVLATCVSACLFDPAAHVGGMNHFLVPEPAPGEPATPQYGCEAMERLLRAVIALGGSRDRMQAKLFGASASAAKEAAIGEHNIAFAKAWLANAGIPITSERLGRTRPLEVHFSPTDGRAVFRER